MGNGGGTTTLGLLYVSRTNIPVIEGQAVLKLVGTHVFNDDVSAFFGDTIRGSAVGHIYPNFTHSIHMPVLEDLAERAIFIEFSSFRAALLALETRNRGILNNSLITCSWSSQAELHSALFPHATIASTNSIYLTRKDITDIVGLCKDCKMQFSGAAIERPFRAVISILSKIPWHLTNSISTIHRDHIFEMLKLSLENANTVLDENNTALPRTIINDLIRCGMCVPGFTEKQKVALLSASNVDCPKDLEEFVFLQDSSSSTPPPYSRNRQYTAPFFSASNCNRVISTDPRIGKKFTVKAPATPANSPIARKKNDEQYGKKK
ncbi:hypothetical protein HK100_002865 [Physocladia obscura]|uniref:Uncharacterized protein n=1 Tax=Physocladia obscura TaxID=109957 RepID=A0AAD5SVR8_9FUNG|nr:hypothetical protein HK100_002865 [Physocladia obscura]